MNVFPNKPLRLLKRRSQSVYTTSNPQQRLLTSYEVVSSRTFLSKQNIVVRPTFTTNGSNSIMQSQNAIPTAIGIAFKSDSTPVGPRTTFKSATKPVESPVPVPRTKSTANEDEPTQYTPGICGLINIGNTFYIISAL
ncbi:unnamed protein product [Adineta ricciae]|uniref:Uncharacterized protein n=1 Tax=Adineta ricciae TaxID=249248 RepID=A0A814WXA4_ADIRI|nr:unnamed protein product [Adineta ricciae]